jgi:hypothetical protein
VRERGAQAAAAVGRVDRRVTPAGRPDLSVGHQPVAVEDADGRRRHVERGLRPVADDVGLLDHHLAEVGLLLGSHQLEDGARVVVPEGAGAEPGG